MRSLRRVMLARLARKLRQKKRRSEERLLRTTFLFESGFFVERRIDLGDLFGLGRRATASVAVAVTVSLAERHPEDAEVDAFTVGADLLERREQLLFGRRAPVGLGGNLLARLDLDRPVLLEAGRGRDQLADDDVLLETEEPVDLALDGRVGQHLRRLLEGRRRQEGLGRERCLRDPEDERLEGRALLLLLLHAR